LDKVIGEIIVVRLFGPVCSEGGSYRLFIGYR